MKTPQEIAADLAMDWTVPGIRVDSDYRLVIAAIEADRAQREAQLTHWVIAEHGKNNPETIVGRYATEFEAHAVAREWNRINRKYGITYRVEEDA